MFPLKKPVYLRFNTDNHGEAQGTEPLQVYGYVETNEPDIFSEMESSSISIICPDPKMYEPTPRVMALDTYQSNTVTNNGTIEVGLVIELTFARNVPARTELSDILFEIQVDEPDGTISIMSFLPHPDGFFIGDKLTISTVSGNKYVKLTRDSSDSGVYNAMQCVVRSSQWPSLKPGDSDVSIGDRNGSTFTATTPIAFHTSFEGV